MDQTAPSSPALDGDEIHPALGKRERSGTATLIPSLSDVGGAGACKLVDCVPTSPFYA